MKTWTVRNGGGEVAVAVADDQGPLGSIAIAVEQADGTAAVVVLWRAHARRLARALNAAART